MGGFRDGPAYAGTGIITAVPPTLQIKVILWAGVIAQSTKNVQKFTVMTDCQLSAGSVR